MQFQTIDADNLYSICYDCVIVGIFENLKLSPGAQTLSQDCQYLISQIIKQGDITGELGQTLFIHNATAQPAKRILLVGLGKEDAIDCHQYRKAITKMLAALATTKTENTLCFLPEINLNDSASKSWKVQHLTQLTFESLYRFEQLKSKKNPQQPVLKQIAIPANSAQEHKELQEAIKIGSAIASGVAITRTLGNLPANICTPSYIAEQALSLAKSFPKLEATILDESDMKELGMGAFLAVAQGSTQPPKLITLEYRGTAADIKPIVLIGKGVTFDSGGISLKPSAAMDEMKFDMCGAATVIGTMIAAAELDLPLNIIGLMPVTENMPNGNAVKPGDIVTSMSGQTIEILNTDAEGRLILCDTLTYSERFNPDVVIDIATLTGAIIVALGNLTTGLMSNCDALANELLTASKTSDDWLWRLPLHDDYKELLSSNFADMANVTDRTGAGSITAACFLSYFVKNLNWAHLDIAGTAWKSGKEKGATGRPVPLLVEFLLKKCP